VPRVAVLLLAVVLVAGLERCWPRALPALVVGVAVAVAYLPWLIFRTVCGIAASSEHLARFSRKRAGCSALCRPSPGAHQRRTPGRRVTVALVARA
jgi:hypothetical protein